MKPSINPLVMDLQHQANVNIGEQLMNGVGLRELTDHCGEALGMKQPKFTIPWNKSFLNGTGTDPLKYIHIYQNNGDSELGIPRHWHYIGFGLTDIHNYKLICKLHETFREQDSDYKKSTQPMPNIYPPPYLLPNGQEASLNGFGFELTFRLECDSDIDWDRNPPNWPAKIMQDLARYVFQSCNTFNDGDHVEWHSKLDNNGQQMNGKPCVNKEHFLMTLDPQLSRCVTSLGPVNFIQIVGVCPEELQAAREWNVREILGMMREQVETGGQYLVTNLRRQETIFDINPNNFVRLEAGIQSTGSDMVQISAMHKSSYTKPNWFIEVEKLQSGLLDETKINLMNEDNLLVNDESIPDCSRAHSRMSQGSESALRIEYADLHPERYYQSIYILLSLNSAKLLPIMLNGRLAHGRTFSFQSFRGDSLITFQPEGCTQQTLVSPRRPYAKKGHWLQVYVSNELRKQMFDAIKDDLATTNSDSKISNVSKNQLKLPKNYSWPEFKLYLTVVKEL